MHPATDAANDWHLNMLMAIANKCNFEPMRSCSIFSIRFTNRRRLMAQPAASILRRNMYVYTDQYSIWTLILHTHSFFLYISSLSIIIIIIVIIIVSSVHCLCTPCGNTIILGGNIVAAHKNKLIIYAARTVHTDLIVINKQYEMNNGTPHEVQYYGRGGVLPIYCRILVHEHKH